MPAENDWEKNIDEKCCRSKKDMEDSCNRVALKRRYSELVQKLKQLAATYLNLGLPSAEGISKLLATSSPIIFTRVNVDILVHYACTQTIISQ